MFKIYGYIPSVYSCAPCMNSKRLLDAKKHEYEFVSVAEIVGDMMMLKQDVIDELEALTGTRKMTMPQIFHDGKHIGGFDQLREYVRTL